jgi:hypothetical protein
MSDQGCDCTCCNHDRDAAPPTRADVDGLVARVEALDYRMVEWVHAEGYSLVQVVNRSQLLALLAGDKAEAPRDGSLADWQDEPGGMDDFTPEAPE